MVAKAKATGKAARGTPKTVQALEASPAERTRENFVVALQKAFEMVPEDAQAVAEIVAERFAGKDEVNDETIDAEVRSLFYTLEAKRLLSFRRIEYDNEAGERRRAFFWRIRSDVVAELNQPEPLPQNEDIYAQLPAECWQRAKAEA